MFDSIMAGLLGASNKVLDDFYDMNLYGDGTLPAEIMKVIILFSTFYSIYLVKNPYILMCLWILTINFSIMDWAYFDQNFWIAYLIIIPLLSLHYLYVINKNSLSRNIIDFIILIFMVSANFWSMVGFEGVCGGGPFFEFCNIIPDKEISIQKLISRTLNVMSLAFMIISGNKRLLTLIYTDIPDKLLYAINYICYGITGYLIVSVLFQAYFLFVKTKKSEIKNKTQKIISKKKKKKISKVT